MTAARENPAFLILGCAAFISGANLRLFDALLPTLAEDFGVAPTVASICRRLGTIQTRNPP